MKISVFFILTFTITIIITVTSFFSYKNKHEKNLEKGDVSEIYFKIAEFDNYEKISALISFKPEKLNEELDKHVKEKGINNFILKKKYIDLGERNYISLKEETKEYILIEYFEQGLDEDSTFRYKVYFSGKIIPVSSYLDYYLETKGMYFGSVFMAFILTLLLNLVIKIVLSIIKKIKIKHL